MAFISLLNNVCILYSANSLHWPILYQSRFFSGNSFIIIIIVMTKRGRITYEKQTKIMRRDFNMNASIHGRCLLYTYIYSEQRGKFVFVT